MINFQSLWPYPSEAFGTVWINSLKHILHLVIALMWIWTLLKNWFPLHHTQEFFSYFTGQNLECPCTWFWSSQTVLQDKASFNRHLKLNSFQNHLTILVHHHYQICPFPVSLFSVNANPIFSVAQGKTLVASFLTHLFLSCPTTNPLANPGDSISKTYP